MPLEFTYSDPLGIEEPAVTVSLSSNSVRFGTLSVSESADVGEAASSGLEVDDPDATWNFVGLRQLVVRETSAPSNNQIVLSGVIQDRKVSRDDSMLTGAARRWSIDLTDYNWHLGKRILVDADAKRPAETAGDRIRWLLTAAQNITLYDYGHVTYPTNQMDAADYRGQRPTDLLADCAVEGGYNFWVAYNEAHRRPELFFMHPGSVDYASGITISNVLSEVNNLSIFAPIDAELTRSARRIAYGAYLPFANGAVYRRNDTTGAQFAKIDQSAPMANVKTAARAIRIADAFLAANAAEDDKITCSIIVPASSVNDLRVGHLTTGRFTHFPGYETPAVLRVLHRTVIQEELGGGYSGGDNEEAWYRLALDLSPPFGYPHEEPTPPVSCGILEANAFSASYNNGDPMSTYTTGPTLNLVSGKAYRMVAAADYVVRPRAEAIQTLEATMNRYPAGAGSFSPSPSHPWVYDSYPAQGETFYSAWYTYTGAPATGWIETHVASVWSPGQACDFRVWVECV